MPSILNMRHVVKPIYVILLASLAVHASPPELHRRLTEAHARRDPAELERAVSRLGVSGLYRLLRPASDGGAPTRVLRLAAIAASPLAEKSWLLLPPLLTLCADRDRDLALAAAEASLQIAEDARLPELQLNEDLPSTLTAESARLAALAGSRAVALDVRVRLIQTLAQLLELVKSDERALLPLLSDPEPTVKRAAIELFVHTSDAKAIARLVALAASDDAEVARAAAATLCAEVPARGPRGAGVLKALTEAGALSALRRHCEDAAASRDQILDIARCLRRSNTVKDRALLRSLSARGLKLR